MPGGWREIVDGPWRHLCPTGGELPEQGWKVHISATPDTAGAVLDAVYGWCAARRLPFKHLRSPRELLRANGKYAPRGSSGKFVTLYPAGEQQLTDVIGGLGERLDGLPGPYILSDLRIGAGPLHVRYGAFRRLELDDGDETRPAIRTPAGELAEDRRAPGFHVPQGVELPEALHCHLTQRGRGELPWKITGALHFSNAGGVYRAECSENGEILVKEARPNAGLDDSGTDAVQRLRRELAALTALAGIAGIPRVFGLRTVWEHLFLAREMLPGVTLGRWLSRHYPLAGNADAVAYRVRALAVADRLDDLVRRVHERGWVFGDLHPGNVLIDDDDCPSLIDAEQASPIGSGVRPALAAPGFARPGLAGVDADRWALAAIRLWLLVPLAPMAECAPGTRAGHVAAAARRFGLTRPAADDLRTDLALPDQEPCEITPDLLVRAITASATPERDDRLFPGDPQQFTDGGAGFGHGAAGVLYALHAAGAVPEPEHVDWLRAHAGTGRSVRAHGIPGRPGLWAGGHGTAVVLDLLGHPGDADELLERCVPSPGRPPRPGLAGGLSGIAWALMRIAVRRGDGRLLGRALDMARRVTALSEEAAPAAGLMRGWTGAALLYTAAYEQTGDSFWLDAAGVALRRDLRFCVPVESGGLQVPVGRRTLPYLDHGSAGLALVTSRLARHRPDDPVVSALPDLLAGCRHSFVVYPGLMSGRAGLILVDPQADPSSLDLYATPFGGGTAFPGTTLRRLSMDLHTGTAGVLLALVSRQSATADPGFTRAAFLPDVTSAGVLPTSASSASRRP
ncbi:class III lanthionine synthetase LanKC [Actinoplanes couchii]|uniref:Serine/threonine protein kinase n=1 Tax=Actinoplanes couchii TaxID=403638 RepID=A0ABQ3XDT8_9ACTN|nr:class III lanthionine synthetase LanKC [Actinoplanes couchii]MDR6317177.1 hypothetical protein [Actinoplanes couchii]GID56672.1 serine/threonine protein kinase [Actinoplanes couchii]